MCGMSPETGIAGCASSRQRHQVVLYAALVVDVATTWYGNLIEKYITIGFELLQIFCQLDQEAHGYSAHLRKQLLKGPYSSSRSLCKINFPMVARILKSQSSSTTVLPERLKGLTLCEFCVDFVDNLNLHFFTVL